MTLNLQNQFKPQSLNRVEVDFDFEIDIIFKFYEIGPWNVSKSVVIVKCSFMHSLILNRVLVFGR